MKKMSLALSVMVLLLFSCTKERKVCSPMGDKMLCQMCSCTHGDPVPGYNGGAACPDGSTPTCKVIKE